MTTDDQALRACAVKRWKKQRDFRIHLLMYLLVNGSLIVIWAMTGAGFFWPVFPIVGWASVRPRTHGTPTAGTCRPRPRSVARWTAYAAAADP
jgi:hypothetical protein